MSPVSSVEPRAVETTAAADAAADSGGKDGHAALGAATLVARPEPRGAGTGSAQPRVAAVVSTPDPAGSGSGGLPWPALIVGCLILLYAGGRVVLGPVETDLFRARRYRLVRRAFPRA